MTEGMCNVVLGGDVGYLREFHRGNVLTRFWSGSHIYGVLKFLQPCINSTVGGKRPVTRAIEETNPTPGTGNGRRIKL